MESSSNPKTDQENFELIQKRKHQIWMIVAVMLVSFCIGTAGLLALIWFVYKTILAQ